MLTKLSMLRHAGIPDPLREAMSTLGFIEVCLALAFVISGVRWPLLVHQYRHDLSRPDCRHYLSELSYRRVQTSD